MNLQSLNFVELLFVGCIESNPIPFFGYVASVLEESVTSTHDLESFLCLVSKMHCYFNVLRLEGKDPFDVQGLTYISSGFFWSAECTSWLTVAKVSERANSVIR